MSSVARDRRVACVLALATTLALAGCTPAHLPAVTVAKPNVVGTIPGKYTGGSRLVLANGDVLTVPRGWKAWLYSRGALVASAGAVPIGLGMTPFDPPQDDAEVSLYAPGYQIAPGFGFAQQLASRKMSYPGYTTFELTAETTVTAFVATQKQRSTGTPQPTVDVDMYVLSRGIDPLEIEISFLTLPAEFAKVSRRDLPRQLLVHYVGLKTP